MRFTFKIALRYIFSLRKFQFITFISILSALGIVLGVSALIIVTSLFSGFREFAEDEIIGLDPHIRIIPKDRNNAAFNKIIRRFGNESNVSIFPFVFAKGIVQHNQNVRVVELYAIADTALIKHPLIRKSVLRVEPKKIDLPLLMSLSIGIGLADGLRVLPGDRVSVWTIEDVDYAVQSLSFPSSKQLSVATIFQTNNNDYDNNYILLAESLLNTMVKNKKFLTNGIDIRIASKDNIERVARELRQDFPECNVYTWYDLNKNIMNAMQFEKYAVFIILSLIISIAVFNILASLFMTVLEKKPDIAVLLTIGTSPKDIQQIFRIQGLAIGIFSTLLGLILGIGLTLGQIHYGWIKLNTQKYIISALPMKISIPTVVVIGLVSIFFSYIATIYPSREASKIVVSESIYKE
ncbi:MAG: FtsX-like permease family protein [Candidatus Kapaibacteriota bacterium]